MGKEIDLLVNYPRSKRDSSKRMEIKEEARKIAREFGQEFFDGAREHGYGGHHYNERFWTPVVPTFQDYYGLKKGSKVLDIGCAKGFMLYDFHRLIPGLEVAGVDISEYAIANCREEMRPFLQVANATHLPYQDHSFDLVISLNTHHNLEGEDLVQGFKELERVSRGKAFVVMDAYRNEEEKKAMLAWNLTAKTIMHVDDWKKFFKEVGYTGDYYWFVP